MQKVEPKVNLWQLITSKKGESADTERCESIVLEARHGAFVGMQELSLSCNTTNWQVEFFGADGGDSVKIRVCRDGAIIVNRDRTINGVRDNREITF